MNRTEFLITRAEETRPGFVLIYRELEAKNPNSTREYLLSRAKTVWYRRELTKKDTATKSSTGQMLLIGHCVASELHK